MIIDNLKYGQNINDAEYINCLIEKAQFRADSLRDDDYSYDAIADIIVNWLDNMDIEPEDLDEIMRNISF